MMGGRRWPDGRRRERNATRRKEKVYREPRPKRKVQGVDEALGGNPSGTEAKSSWLASGGRHGFIVNDIRVLGGEGFFL